VIDLLIAKEWGIPPWEVEDAPDIWVQRWLELADATAPGDTKHKGSLI